MNDVSIGLSTYSLGTPLHLDGLEALAEAGFRYVEYAYLFYHPDIDPVALGKDVAAAAQRAGLEVWSVHAPLDEGTDIASLDEAARRYAVGRMVKTLDLAQRSLNELFKRASQRGLGLAIENNPGPFVASSAAEIAWMLRMVDGEVGLCLDTGHANLTGQLDSILKTLCQHIVTLHLNDNDGEEDAHWLPGAGTINWRAVAEALRDCGYNGPWLCELAPSVVEQSGDLKAIAEGVRTTLGI